MPSTLPCGTRPPTAGYLSAAYRSLAGPASLTAIALLVVNDHLLKARCPSSLTGKLSDLAGLYFAPFLVLLAVLTVVWLCQRTVSPRRQPSLRPAVAQALAMLAFVAVGALFAALKLSAATAQPVHSLLEAVAGHRLAIVTDPTDLMALGTLALAYMSWRRRLARAAIAPIRPAGDGLGRRQLGPLLLVALAGLASLASVDPPPTRCAEVKVAGIAADPHQAGRLWATKIEDIACTCWQQGGDTEPRYTLYRTDNSGRSWSECGPGGARIVPDPLRADLIYLTRYDGLWLYDAASGELEQLWPADGEEAQPDIARYELGLAVAAPPWRAGLVYVGLRGAVGRSEDGGRTWTILPLAGAPSEPLSALAVVPSQPGLLYAAQGAQLWSSRDGGERWEEGGLLPGPALALAASPTDPQHLVAGMEAGVAVSADGGRSWPAPGWKGGPITSLAFDPGSHTIYAAARQTGLVASRDDGQTWEVSLPGDVRDVTVAGHRAFVTTVYELPGGSVAPSWGGVYRQRGWWRLPFQGEWEPADDGLGNAPPQSGGRFAEMLWWAGLLGVALAVGGAVASRGLRQAVRRSPWGAAHGLVSIAACLLLLCAIASGEGVNPIDTALLGGWGASIVLALLVIPARLSLATWILGALPLVLTAAAAQVGALSGPAAGLLQFLAIYYYAALTCTLTPSICLREARPRVSKALLIAGSLAMVLWWPLLLLLLM